MTGLNGLIGNALSINGTNVKGNIRELKAGVTVEQAFRAGQKDNLDQVYFEANGKKYVAQGDGLALSSLKKGDLPVAQVYLDGKKYDANIMAVDNEKNTAGEGWWNLGTKIGLGVVGAGVFMMLGGDGKTGEAAMSHAVGTMSLLIGGVGLTAGSAVVGAGYRSLVVQPKAEKLADLLKP